MLQAFIDESGFGEAPVYVLAGWISTTEKWASFSDEWRQILDMKPRIDYFKTNEAMTFDGQFRHWRADMRDEKILLLNSAIDNYTLAGITCSLSHKDWRTVIQRPQAKARLKSPYYYLLYGLIEQWFEARQRLGFGKQAIEFVFDEQVMESDQIRETWQNFRDISYLPKRYLDSIVGYPLFRDDKRVLPLQAADVLAWQTRRRWVENADGWPILLLPRQKSHRETGIVANFEWNEIALRSRLDALDYAFAFEIKSKLMFSFGSWKA